jgi:hypothetical protein
MSKKLTFKRPQKQRRPAAVKEFPDIAGDNLPVDIFKDWDLIPPEVREVFLQDMGRDFTTIRNLERRKAAVLKYPRWFPWETRYNSIPQEVHDAYLKETGFGDVRDTVPTGEGLIYLAEKQGEYQLPTFEETKFNILNWIKQKEEAETKARLEEIRRKAIWNKHYRKYNLTYRG